MSLEPGNLDQWSLVKPGSWSTPKYLFKSGSVFCFILKFRFFLNRNFSKFFIFRFQVFFAVEFEDNEDLENNAGASAKKPFTAVISKLECLSLSATSTLV